MGLKEWLAIGTFALAIIGGIAGGVWEVSSLLDEMRAEIRTEMKDMRADMKDMRVDMNDMRADMNDMRVDMNDMRVDLIDRMNSNKQELIDRMNSNKQELIERISQLEKSSAAFNAQIDARVTNLENSRLDGQ